jgi:PAB-dependent poly(A)-specific ribonuclease subunit 3
MNETLRERLLVNMSLTTDRLYPDNPLFPTLPATLDSELYHSILPISSDGIAASSSTFHVSRVPPDVDVDHRQFSGRYRPYLYKVSNAVDGRTYLLRRLTACRTPCETVEELMAPWQQLQKTYGLQASTSPFDMHHSSQIHSDVPSIDSHPHFVALRRVCTINDFADAHGPSLCLVYDYFPGARTLEQQHLSTQSITDRNGTVSIPTPITEELLWSYISQLLSVLIVTHSAGLAFNGLINVRRILVTSPGRIRVNGIGIREGVLGHSDATAVHNTNRRSNNMVRQQQLDDLFHFR